jgi:hypothetical protein
MAVTACCGGLLTAVVDLRLNKATPMKAKTKMKPEKTVSVRKITY